MSLIKEEGGMIRNDPFPDCTAAKTISLFGIGL